MSERSDQPDMVEGGVPVEGVPMEVEPTRRSASAQFNVESDIGSAAAMREAMDPANKSLADALQLSFRVLQFVIFILLILFLFSGFKTIGNGESGVSTVWGQVEDLEGLGPGLQMNWPPPIGDFVVVSTESRTQTDGRVFGASFGGAASEQEAIEQATYEGLKPGRDGSLIVAGEELAHIEVKAVYEVDKVVPYIEHLERGATDVLVRLALQRAVVHVGASHTLNQLRTDMSNDELRTRIQDQAQSTLDAVSSGLKILDIQLIENVEPPRFIQQSFEEYTVNLQLAQQEIQNARKFAEETLIRAAGEHWPTVSALIEEYELQWELEDPSAPGTLARINSFFDGDSVAGEASNAISNARGYLADIETSLGMEARRFEGLLEAYREHPQLVITERWLNARNAVMSRPDVEMVYVPHQLGAMAIDLTGLQSVKDIRRRLAMERKEASAMFEGLDLLGETMQRIDEMKEVGKPGRQLKIDSTGRPKGMREESP